MIAFWSRALIAVEVLVLSLFAAALVRWAGSSITAAAAAAFALFLLLHLLGVLFSFLIARNHVADIAREQAIRPFLSRLLAEWLAFMAVFVAIQPFERWWMGDDSVAPGNDGRPPVLLVHGYLCNRGAWWWMRRRLRAAGLRVATVNLEPPFASIDQLVGCLASRIARLRAETGARDVMLVAHSMGGLVARAYLQRHGPIGVAGLITLGTPHHGTHLARYGLGRNACEMRPGSGRLDDLNVEPASAPLLSAWSPVDNFILPPHSSRLAGAREIILPPLTHLAMGLSDEVARLIVREMPDPQT